MTLKYHGLFIETQESGQFRFGIVPLINGCQSWIWRFEKTLPDTIKESLKRFDNKAYWQCAQKSNYTINKIKIAVYRYSQCIDILERRDEFLYVNAPIDKTAIYYEALEDITYHLDALFSYLRILADCIVFAIPFFYKSAKNISNTSFRKHSHWFTVKNPCFDSEYTSVLREHSQWFEILAGKKPKGIRDTIFHNFGTYQVGFTSSLNGQNKISISQITSGGFENQDITFKIDEMLYGFFEYLDKTYSIFGARIAEEFSPLIPTDLEKRSLLYKFSDPQNMKKKYKLYPFISL